MLTRVNVSDSWLNEASRVMQCKTGSIPFVYLGIPIDGDCRRLRFWYPLLERNNLRLSSYKSKNLSFRGRLVLLKFVMSSLPVYFLSFLKAPTGIISSIEYILIFFFGGEGDLRKISWVNWDSVSRSKEDGGLGVKRLRQFNLSLLGKWCWRSMVDKYGLWYSVLKARYK